VLKYFQDLGERIEKAWHRADFDVASFPSICCEALEASPVHRAVSTEDILRWALSSRRLPEQHDPEAKFGEPPITLHLGHGFFIAVNLWLTSTPAIHNHSFSGAFQVLEGGSLETNFRFSGSRAVNDHMVLGKLKALNCGVLTTGSTRPIVAGRTIHALFHLEHPSATIIVRTGRDPSARPQLVYWRSGVGIDTLYNPAELLRRKQLLTFVHRTAPERLVPTCLRYMTGADFVSRFAVLRHCGMLLAPAEADSLLQRAKRVDGVVAALASDVLECERREAFLIRRRAPIKDPDLRFFLALLLNVRGRVDALALIKRRYPRKDPIALVLNWVRALDRSPGPEDGSSSALGFPLDDVLLGMLEGALRGRTPTAIVRSIERTAGRSLTKSDVKDLQSLRAALQQSEIFRYLLE